MLFAYEDYVKNGTVSPATGYTFSSTLPITNMQDDRLKRIARQASGAGVVFWADLGSTKAIRLVALLAHNIASGSVLSVKLWSGTPAAPGTVVAEQVNVGAWQPPNVLFPRHQMVVFDAAYSARSIQIISLGPFDPPPGLSAYFECGRLWASNAWVASGITVRLTPEWSMRIADPGKVSYSEGQQAYPQRQARYRKSGLSLEAIPFTEAYGAQAQTTPDWESVLMQAGTTDPVICIPRLTDTHAIHRLAVFGALEDVSTITHQRGDNYKLSFSVREWR